uniref:Uncharacterized protein n=1 Tax=Plectus sambesii TaxID=2011161 RepID=A0A914VN40_9BILA
MAYFKKVFVHVVFWWLLLMASPAVVTGAGFYSFGATPGGALYSRGVSRLGGTYNFGRAPGGLLYNHGITPTGTVYSSTASKHTGISSYLASSRFGVHSSGIRPNGGFYGYGTRPGARPGARLGGLFGRRKRDVRARRYSNPL